MARTGRPSKYDPKFAPIVLRLMLLGKTEEQVAGILGISRATLSTWKKQHPEFLDAITRGRDEADGRVAAALFQRALGYSHKETKVFLDRNGNVVRVEVDKHYPPDTLAAIHWLNNRQRAVWYNERPRDNNPAANPDEQAAKLLQALREMDDMETTPDDEDAVTEADANDG